jgi:hypothetical protein
MRNERRRKGEGRWVLKPEVRERGLSLISTLPCLHVSGHSCIMVGTEKVRSGLVRITFVVVIDGFVSVGEVEG